MSNQTLISFRTQSKQTDSDLAGRRASQPEREAEKEGLLVVAVMLSVLCTAIVHQSLLEAKSVRTEQGFPRDPSLSAGMPRRKFSPREQRMDQRTPDMFTAPSSQKDWTSYGEPVWNRSTSSGAQIKQKRDLNQTSLSD